MYKWVIWQNSENIAFHRKCTVHCTQNWPNFGLTCVPEKGRGFVTVRTVTANLVSKDARDFKEKSHETARRDLLVLRTYRAKRLGGGFRLPPPPAFLGLIRALTLKFVPLGTAEQGSSPLSSKEKKRLNKRGPQGIKGAFSAVFDALSFLIKNNSYFFLKKSAPFFCGITRDYCL